MPENLKYADVKRRTIELYDSLPQEKEARMARLDVRDEVIQLNYKFFGYVAAHTYINNTAVTYDDKFQSALCHFCECWYWYKWEGHYRTDLSFSVFFKPRIGEMIERELNEVKYSVRRSLCMEAGAQLGKHWAKVTYDDLKNVKLPANKMIALKSIFGSVYAADLEEHELYIPAPEEEKISEWDLPSDSYDTVEELLIHEMIEQEKKITPSQLKKMSEIYSIDLNELKAKLVIAEKMLYERLHKSLADKY